MNNMVLSTEFDKINYFHLFNIKKFYFLKYCVRYMKLIVNNF